MYGKLRRQAASTFLITFSQWSPISSPRAYPSQSFVGAAGAGAGWVSTATCLGRSLPTQLCKLGPAGCRCELTPRPHWRVI